MRESYGVRPLRSSVAGRLALALAVTAAFLALLAQRLGEVDLAALAAALAGLPVVNWVLALVATAVSYAAIARYDIALHRHLATGVSDGRAGSAGLAALAISQTVGMGVLSAAMVRWRMLPELGPWGAMRLSVAVTVGFLVAWAALVLAALTLLPGPFAFPPAPLILAALGLALVLGLRFWRQGMPNLITALRVLFLVAVDCTAAGVALWLLVPGAPEFGAFLPVFLLALGAGLVSTAPGGIGVFEVVLLAGCPEVPLATLLAGVLAWRLVYHLVPSGAALALLLRGPRPGPAAPASPWPRRPAPEQALVAQGELVWHPAGFLAGQTAHALVAMGGAIPPGRLTQAAAAMARWPVYYKIPARQALRARRAGFRLLPVALEGWLDPQAFTTDEPRRAGLRRKLRRAAQAGVVAMVEAAPPLGDLAQVNAAWITAHGGEFGFSMGRFDARGLPGPVVVARVAGQVVGFCSFHCGWTNGQRAWALDLLRPAPGAPDGTAQAMILAALTAARADGAARLSLAAVPLGAMAGERGLVARLQRRHCPAQARGLHQFKEGFAPHWQRLYLAAPHWLALALAGAEIAQAIRHPPPKLSPAARRDAEYEIALGPVAWQGEGTLAN